MKTTVPTKTWEKTRLQNLMRHKSGRYYARLYRNGKEIWQPLKTSHFSVAESRLAAALKENREQRLHMLDTSNAKLTFHEGATLHLQQIDGDATLKRRTRAYWHEVDIALRKSWPSLANMEMRQITPGMCREWAARYGKSVSATRYNGAISFFRHVVKLAIENDVLHADPTAAVKRMAVRGKHLELPTRAQFIAFTSEIRVGHSRDSKNCADLVQGLAFTGCRISEAAQIEWRDLDFAVGEIFVRGDPQERTKNGEVRRVPMIAEARELFTRMHQSRGGEPSSAKVFLVRESQKAMDRAAGKIKMSRITHHDLRHLFATICIESGVDIPTVSRWLGHKDGGALAMRTYGHLRREHSIAQAQKVSFAQTLPNGAISSVPSAELTPPDAREELKVASSKQKPPSSKSWVASIGGERPKTLSKRLADAERKPEFRSLP